MPRVGSKKFAYTKAGKVAAKKYAKQLEIDPQPILDDMMSGDYEHLLEVFEEQFGSFVTLYR